MLPDTPAVLQRKELSAAIQRRKEAMLDRFIPGGIPSKVPTIQRKSSTLLPLPVQNKMEATMGADFSNVNIHPNSQQAQEVGALAYTQGNDVHFAPGQFDPDSQKGQSLIGHELAHVVQQQQSRVQATTQAKGLPVNDDPALENEADTLGDKAAQMKEDEGASILDKEEEGAAQMKVAQMQGDGAILDKEEEGAAQMKSGGLGKVAQLKIQEKGMKVTGGEFEIDMEDKQIPPEVSAGERGTIKFNPNEKSPDTKDIRLIQIVKTNDMTQVPIKDYDWTGSGEDDRMKVQTSAVDTDYLTIEGDTLTSISKKKTGGQVSPAELFAVNSGVLGAFDPVAKIPKGSKITIPKIKGGYFVDHEAASATAAPRTAKGDAEVPVNYRSYWPNAANSQDGHKKGKDIAEASLWDFPGGGATFDITFDFETVARSYDKGFDYGTLHWGFHLNKGKIEGEYHFVANRSSPTFKSAIKEFNEHYENHHMVVQGDTLWELAELYYGDPTKWTKIQKANGLKDTIIVKGQLLIIPDVTNTK